MKKPSFLAICLLLLWAYSARAQQLPLFSQYREYGSAINPAWVGEDYLFYLQPASFGVSYRRQWLAAGDGPSTQMLRGDYVIENNGVNLITGGYLVNDKIGRVSTTGLYGRLAGVKVWDNAYPRNGGIAAGIAIGAMHYGLDLTDARVKDAAEIPAASDLAKNFYDVGVGIYAYQKFGNDEHFLSGGVSVPQVFGLDLQFRDENGEVNIQKVQHFYTNLNYRKELGSTNAFLELSTWGKFVAPVKPHFDFNFRWSPGGEERFFWLGAGLGTSKMVHAEGGFCLTSIAKINMLRVGYSFQYPFSSVSTYFGSTHEINLAISFGGEEI